MPSAVRDQSLHRFPIVAAVYAARLQSICGLGAISIAAVLFLALALHISLFSAPAQGMSAPDAAEQTAPALVRAANGVLPLGGISVTLAVSVSNVVNLGAVTAELGYNNTVLAPVHCRLNRAAFSVGLCNLTYDSNGDGIADAVRFNLATLSGVSASANAPLMLVEVSWIATGTAAVGMTTPLSTTVSNFANSDGAASPFTTQDSQIAFEAAPQPTATPLPTNSPIPTPLTTPETTPTAGSPTPPPPGGAAAIFLPVVASP